MTREEAEKIMVFELPGISKSFIPEWLNALEKLGVLKLDEPRTALPWQPITCIRVEIHVPGAGTVFGYLTSKSALDIVNSITAKAR